MILKFLWNILDPEPIPEEIYIPQFYINKHYDDMTRREKREYKRWLNEHDMWDAAEVIERWERNGSWNRV